MKDDTVIIIPARGGSKRLSYKNLLLVDGRSLVMRAVDRAADSQLGRVIVSTEDKKIQEHLKTFQRNPWHFYIHSREESLAQDDARAWEVCLNVLLVVQEYKTLIMTLPTSPFCTANDLQLAYQMFLNNDRRPILSVTKQNFNPNTLGIIDGDYMWPFNPCPGKYSFYWDSKFIKEGQKKRTYLSNGAIFICDISRLRQKKEQYIDGMIGYVMPRDRGLDINTEMDYEFAKFLAERESK